MDGSALALAEAKVKGFPGRQADLRRKIPLGDGKARVVTCTYAEHLLGEIYPEVYRILDSGGILVMNLYPKDDVHKEEVRQSMRDVGFDVTLEQCAFIRKETSEHGDQGDESLDYLFIGRKS